MKQMTKGLGKGLVNMLTFVAKANIHVKHTPIATGLQWVGQLKLPSLRQQKIINHNWVTLMQIQLMDRLLLGSKDIHMLAIMTIMPL